MAFIIGGIAHDHVQILHQRFLCPGYLLLETVDIQLAAQPAPDLAHQFGIADLSARTDKDTAEELEVNTAVDLLDKFPVGQSRITLEYH